jgi:hypothetical protein
MHLCVFSPKEQKAGHTKNHKNVTTGEHRHGGIRGSGGQFSGIDYCLNTMPQ